MTLQEYLKEQLNLQVLGKLGTSLGLRATRAVPIADEVLPAQLDQLQQIARTPEGSQQLWDLAQDRVPAGTVQQLIGTAEKLKTLQAAGATLLPEVMGPSYIGEVSRLAASSKISEAQVRQLMELLLPLLLSLIAGRATAEKLRPEALGTLFGGTAAVSGVAAATLSSKPEVIVEQGTPVREVPVTRTAPPVRLVQEEPKRRGFGWLWLLPLLLLVLLGGCFLLRGKGVAGLTLSSPQSAARTTVGGPLTFTGTGRAGETVTVSENGAAVTSTKVDSTGQYSATVPVPATGAHTYTVSETGTNMTLNRAVTVAAATSAAAVASDNAASVTSSTTPASTPLAITAPTSDSTVQAGALTLKGTGPAGTELSLSEDGTSLGQVRTDASGAWSFQVPSPATGAHTYTASADSASSDLKLTVAAGTAAAGTCSETFSLSLKDGQTVKEPFRFGGVGSGKSYSVTVRRGERKIGSKVLPLDSSCGYSYTSKPGIGRVTYTLKENGQAAIARTITLNVRR